MPKQARLAGAVRSRRTTACEESERPGLGLGVFIAKTLLERSGARVLFENGAVGAVVRKGLLARGKPSVVVFSTRGLADGWLVDSLARAGVPVAALAVAGARR